MADSVPVPICICASTSAIVHRKWHGQERILLLVSFCNKSVWAWCGKCSSFFLPQVYEWWILDFDYTGRHLHLPWPCESQTHFSILWRLPTNLYKSRSRVAWLAVSVYQFESQTFLPLLVGILWNWIIPSMQFILTLSGLIAMWQNFILPNQNLFSFETGLCY